MSALPGQLTPETSQVTVVIRSFKDKESLDIFQGTPRKRARKRLPQPLWGKAQAKLDELDAASNPAQLLLPSNRLHRLRGDREGMYAIAINLQYRICFRWEEGDAWEVEVTDYH